jgi:probable HAF family extracellular repeat protein
LEKIQGVSADGSVVVGSSSAQLGGEAFRWTADTGMVGLGELPDGLGSFAWAVSGDGSVVVGRAALPGDFEPFLWDEAGGMRSFTAELVALGLGLDLAGWDLEVAHAASYDGETIVGWGYNPAGDQEAFVAYLGP